MKKTLLFLTFTFIVFSGCGGSGSNTNSNPIEPTDPTKIFNPYVMLETGGKPESVAIGDVNNDGRKDVVMTTGLNSDSDVAQKLLVFLQNDSLTLDPPLVYDTASVVGMAPTSVAIGDINNDLVNEVVVGNTWFGIQVFSQDNFGDLYPSASYLTENSERIRLADLNGDDRLDIVGVGYNTHTVDVYYQDIDGTLKPPVIYNVEHNGLEDLDVGDVNDDGLIDVILTDGRTVPYKIIVLTQTIDGSLNEPIFYDYGTVFEGGVAVGDVTGDGMNDVVVTYGGNSGELSVFPQDDLGLLGPETIYPSYDGPESVDIADLNSDSKEDIVVIHGGWDTLGVYLQKDDGSLSEEEHHPLPRASHYNPHGLALGDINSDGLTDVAIASFGNTSGLVVLYHK